MTHASSALPYAPGGAGSTGTAEVKGNAEVQRVYHLDRGYEAIEQKFSALGAAIRRVK